MARRHEVALLIQNGAVNPQAVARSIVTACEDIRAQPNFKGTDQLTSDPAIRLMVHQLAYICKVYEIEQSLTVYGELLEDCKDRKIVA